VQRRSIGFTECDFHPRAIRLFTAHVRSTVVRRYYAGSPPARRSCHSPPPCQRPRQRPRACRAPRSCTF
jgi:hypothetical protein